MGLSGLLESKSLYSDDNDVEESSKSSGSYDKGGGGCPGIAVSLTTLRVGESN